MKAAFSTWNNRIAPVFDSSNQIFLVEVEAGNIIRQQYETLPNDLPVQAALRLAETKAEILICGAISREMHTIIGSYGIHVIPFVAGDLSEVVQSWCSGRTDWARFAMPGCMGLGRRRFGQMAGNYQERFSAKGRGPVYREPGRHENGKGIRVTGHCVCPQCGLRQPHHRGIPCLEHCCPGCGTAMIRE